MVEPARAEGWWVKERERDFTKLECGLIGALFATVVITFMIVMRFMVL